MTERNREVLRALLERIDLAEAMRRRGVQESIAAALPEVWRRRAQQFRAAAVKPGDHPGQATLRELAEQSQRCLDTALACERHAALLGEVGPAGDLRDLIDHEIDLVLGRPADVVAERAHSAERH